MKCAREEKLNLVAVAQSQLELPDSQGFVLRVSCIFIKLPSNYMQIRADSLQVVMDFLKQSKDAKLTTNMNQKRLHSVRTDQVS